MPRFFLFAILIPLNVREKARARICSLRDHVLPNSFRLLTTWRINTALSYNQLLLLRTQFTDYFN
jgi:hypothetical protein